MIQLEVALDQYPHTDPLRRGEIASASVSLHFIDFDDIIQAFRPMAMFQAFDVAEMALVTFLQAHAVGQPVLLLPAVTTGDIHHDRLRVLPGRRTLAPEDLKGRRVGVRAYSQTTGLWVRGILAEEYGIGYGDLEWVTTEGAHVDGYEEPPFVQRAPEGTSLHDLLQQGEVDAIVARAGPETSALIPDIAARKRAWYGRHGAMGINHMITVRSKLFEEQPEIVAEVYRMLQEAHRVSGALQAGTVATDPAALPSAVSFGVDNVRTAVELAGRYACEQGLISQPPRIDEIFPSVLVK